MESISRFLMACAAVALVAAAPLDTAVIVGSRGSIEYEIVVRSDGTASISTATSGLKEFTIPRDTVAHFFTALAASRIENWTSGPCEHELPDETIRVRWHGWVSADVVCPPHETDALYDAMRLNNTVMAIVVYAGPPAAIPCYELPGEWRPPNCHRP